MDRVPSSVSAYTGDEPCVFVSYAHDDELRVYALLERLSSAGIRLWFDKGIHPGSSWRDELADAIERCHLFLYFITPASASSRNCQRECSYALDREKRLLAVHLRATDLPHGLALGLADQQAILAYQYPTDEFEARLVEAVSRLLGSGDHASSSTTPRRIDKPRWRSAVRWRAGVGLALIAIAIPLVWLWADRHPLTSSANASLKLLVSTQDTATFPAVARDGSLLTYVGGKGNRRDLFVRTLRGGTPIRITDDDAREATPRLSPDGTEIAFARFDAEDRLPAVFRIAALGGKPRLVVEAARSPVWSPDGRALAYVSIRPDHAQSIHIIDLLDASERTLFEVTAPYVSITALDWGRRNQYVVVLSTGGISGDLWVVEANGTSRLLIDDPPNVFSHDAVFSEDDRAVIYTSNRAGAVNLWQQGLGGEQPEQLTRGPGPDELPTVTGTGQIVFQSSSARNELVVADTSGAVRTLLSHHAPIWAPAFSPDGNLIAYSQAETDGSWHIWVTKPDGSETRQVTDGDKPEIYPRFMANGREVLYFTWTQPRGGVWRVNVDGGAPRPVTPADWDASYADADRSQRIVVTRMVDGETRLALLDLATPQAEPQDLGPGTLPRWSPDDEWIAFTLDRTMLSGVYLMRPDGTARRQLTDFGGWPTWFPDGRVGFTALGSNADQQNFVVGVDDRTPKPMPGPEYEGANFPFDVAPDGLGVVTSNSSHISDEIWLLSR